MDCTIINDEKLSLIQENNNKNNNNYNISNNSSNSQDYYNIKSSMIPSITSSPLQHRRFSDSNNNINSNNSNNNYSNIIQQSQSQQHPTTFEKVWGLFFSLDRNDNNNKNNIDVNSNNSNSSIISEKSSIYVDENQKYIKEDHNESSSSVSTPLNSSDYLASSSSKNNIILDNSSGSSINNNMNYKEEYDYYSEIKEDNYDQEIIEEEQDQEGEDRIWNLFFSLSINPPSNNKKQDNNNSNNSNKSSLNSNNSIKYNNLILQDKNNNKITHSNNQKSIENVIIEKPIIQISSDEIIKEAEEQLVGQENGSAKKVLETSSAEVVKSIFEKSPFFEPSRPVVDYSDPVFLEPIESKLPGNLEKNKHLYENIRPNPIPLSVILTGITIKDLEGNDVLVTSLYEKKRVVLAIFRRFGCLICRLQALDLSSLKPKLDKMGIELIGIGFDEEGIEEFIDYKFFAGKIYLDKNRQVYRALNLKRRSKLTTYELFLDPRVMTYYRRMKELGLPSNYRKDGFQLGATLVLGPRPQETLYDFRPQRYADIFDLKEIWAACQTPYPDESEIGNIKKLDLTIPKPITIKCDPVHFNLSSQPLLPSPPKPNYSIAQPQIQSKEQQSSDSIIQPDSIVLDSEINYNNNLANISIKLSNNVYLNTKKEKRNKYYDEDEDYDEDSEYYDSQDDEEDYDEDEEGEYYDDDYEVDDEMESDDNDFMKGVRLPKPSEDSIRLLQLLDTIQLDPSLFNAELNNNVIFNPPPLELSDQQQQIQQPSAIVSNSQEQEYIDKINNTDYNSNANYGSFYKVSKSSNFIIRDKDEEENQLIYCPYKFQG